MPLALNEPTLSEALSPSFEPGRKLGAVPLAVLWQLLEEAPQCPSRVVLDKLAQHQPRVQVSIRHLNRLRAKWKRSRPKGRPRHQLVSAPHAQPAALVQLTPHVSRVGVHLFARWLEQQGLLTPLVLAVQQAIEVYQRHHRDEDFALLHHRPDTLLRRLQALVLAPVSGMSINPFYTGAYFII